MRSVRPLRPSERESERRTPKLRPLKLERSERPTPRPLPCPARAVRASLLLTPKLKVRELPTLNPSSRRLRSREKPSNRTSRTPGNFAEAKTDVVEPKAAELEQAVQTAEAAPAAK